MMKRLLCLLLALPLSAFAQVALVGHTSAGYGGSGSGSSPVTTPALNTTGANFIAVCAANSSGVSSAGTVTDSLNNVWLKANKQQEDGDSQITLWHVIGPATSASQTFTLTGHAPALAVMAFSGVASGPDQQNQSVGTYRGTATAGSITPTNNNELIVSCLSEVPVGTANVQAPLTTADFVQYNGGYNGGVGVGSGYQIQTTSTPINVTWNINGLATGILSDSFFSAISPAPLVVTSTGVAEGFVSSSYNYQLKSSGGVGPFTWAITSGTLPAGLSMSSGGLITGTPTTVVSADRVIFQVTDSHGSTGSATLPITVAAAALILTSTNCPSTVIGTQYQPLHSDCALVATGGTSPYTYSWKVVTDYTWAALPEGLSLNTTTGAITGTVYGQGGYIVQFITTDSIGTTAIKNIHFSITGDSTLGGCLAFPNDTIFHTDISTLPVDTSPAAPLNSAYLPHALQIFFGSGPGGLGKTPNGIPYMRVPATQPNVAVTTRLYQSYYTMAPFPWYAPIESTSNGSGDRHVSVIQMDPTGGTNCKLWEMWQGISENGPWSDSSNADWPNLGSSGAGAYQMLPQDSGSTDAAGLPLLPLLVNADEVIGTGTPTAPNGVVHHPIRFTVPHMLNAYVWPATAHAGTGHCTGGYHDSNRMLLQANPPTSCTGNSGPAGEIYRLMSSVPDPPCAASSPQAAIIIQGFRHYGIILADNGGTGGLIGTPDARWNDADLKCLTNFRLSNFEPVNVSSIATNILTSYQVGPNYTLSTSVTGRGSGTITGCTGGYLPGQRYSCTVTTNLGSQLRIISGCGGTLSGSAYSGVMPASNCTVAADFELLPGSVGQGSTIVGATIKERSLNAD